MRVVNQKRVLHVKQVEVGVASVSHDLTAYPLQAEQEQVSRRYQRLSEHRHRKGSDIDNNTDQS